MIGDDNLPDVPIEEQGEYYPEEPDGPILMDEPEPEVNPEEEQAAAESDPAADNDVRLEIARAQEGAEHTARANTQAQEATVRALDSIAHRVEQVGQQVNSQAQQAARPPAPTPLTVEEQREAMEQLGPDRYINGKLIPAIVTSQNNTTAAIRQELAAIRQEQQDQNAVNQHQMAKAYVTSEMEKSEAALKVELDELPLTAVQKQEIQDEYDAALEKGDAGARYFVQDPSTRILVGNHLGDLRDRVIGRRGRMIAEAATQQQRESRAVKRGETHSMRPGSAADRLVGGQPPQPKSFEQRLYEQR